MLTVLLKKLIVICMSILNLFSVGRTEWADSCADHDFPRIAAEAQAEGTVRIMSFNIRCSDVNGVGVRDRIRIAVQQIGEILPDVFGVQEATPEWMWALSAALPYYGWVGVERENGGSPLSGDDEACPIFYLKTKFSLVDSGSFWLSETPDVPSDGLGAACRRICTWAKLRDRRTGDVFIHINTHFDHISEAARVTGAEVVAGFISESCDEFPVVFTADMNTYEGRAAYNIMTSKLTNARLAAEDAVSFGTFHACSPETHQNSVIDFILCSEDVTVKAYRTVTKGVDDRFVSDHFPIYADVILPENGGRRPVC